MGHGSEYCIAFVGAVCWPCSSISPETERGLPAIRGQLGVEVAWMVLGEPWSV